MTKLWEYSYYWETSILSLPILIDTIEWNLQTVIHAIWKWLSEISCYILSINEENKRNKQKCLSCAARQPPIGHFSILVYLFAAHVFLQNTQVDVSFCNYVNNNNITIYCHVFKQDKMQHTIKMIILFKTLFSGKYFL